MLQQNALVTGCNINFWCTWQGHSYTLKKKTSAVKIPLAITEAISILLNLIKTLSISNSRFSISNVMFYETRMCEMQHILLEIHLKTWKIKALTFISSSPLPWKHNSKRKSNVFMPRSSSASWFLKQEGVSFVVTLLICQYLTA